MNLPEWIDFLNTKDYFISMGQELRNEHGELQTVWRVRIWKQQPAGVLASYAIGTDLLETIRAAYAFWKMEAGELSFTKPAKAIVPKYRGQSMDKGAVASLLSELGL